MPFTIFARVLVVKNKLVTDYTFKLVVQGDFIPQRGMSLFGLVGNGDEVYELYGDKTFTTLLTVVAHHYNFRTSEHYLFAVPFNQDLVTTPGSLEMAQEVIYSEDFLKDFKGWELYREKPDVAMTEALNAVPEQQTIEKTLMSIIEEVNKKSKPDSPRRRGKDNIN